VHLQEFYFFYSTKQQQIIVALQQQIPKKSWKGEITISLHMVSKEEEKKEILFVLHQG
jgi:hypothetical protein